MSLPWLHNSPRSKFNAGKGGSERTIHKRRVALFQPLSHPQEGWKEETSNKLDKTEPVYYRFTSLQDGAYTHSERAVEKDDESGPGGHILMILIHPRDRTVLSSESSLHLPALWPIVCSMGLYQDPETSGANTQRARGESGDLDM